MAEDSSPKTPVEQDVDRRSDRERLGAVESRLEEVVGMLLRLSEGVQDLTAQARNSSPLKRRLGSNRNARVLSTGNRLGSLQGASLLQFSSGNSPHQPARIGIKSRKHIMPETGEPTTFEARIAAAGT
jgi:hypothetical protein